MPSAKNVLFTLRHYNDIDHIVPIIWKMEGIGDTGSFAYAYDPTLDIEQDFRLNYLRRCHKSNIQSIYTAYQPGPKYKVLAKLLARQNPITKHIPQFRKRLFSLIGNKYYDERWCRSLLRKNNIGVVVTDWQRPKRYLTLQLYSAARQLGLPVVSVPHGIRMWVGRNEGDRERYVHLARFFDMNIVTHEELRSAIVQSGIEATRVKTIGSARYCDEWDDVYDRIHPDPLNEAVVDGSLKVVFMDHSAVTGIRTEAVNSAISKLANMDGVKLIVKPSTRGGTNISRLPGKNIVFDEATPSRALIKWADVVICTVSSIILDAMRMQKVFLYPGYFIDREMLWERFSACWTVNNDEEFLAAINSLKQDKSAVPYRQSDVNQFLAHVVNGGVSGRDVLGDYVSEIIDTRDRYIYYSQH